MVNVVDNNQANTITQNNAVQQGGGILSQVPWDLVINISIIAVIVIIFLGIIFWILYKIYNKIKDIRRKKTDLEYYKYTSDLKMCHLNSDSKFRRRNPLFLWLFWKRSPIYANTEHGKKMIGYYDGEAVKKEGFFLIALFQKHSLFQSETDVVIMPYELSKYLLKRNDDDTLELNCEGIDEVMSSEYYSIPVIKNFSEDKERIFTDFSNMVSTKFFKEYVYRDVIKTNIKDYAEGIKDATEMNPNIQYNRKDNSNLRNN